jgi:hypothetical protein
MEASVSNRNRRIVGFLVGMTFGLLYTWVSQFINVWALPGIPLYEPPLGRVETVILGALFMGMIGAIVCWDQESFWGLFVAALFGVVVSSVQAYINSGENDFLKSVIVFTFTFLPRFVFYLPLGIFFRWLTSLLEDAVMFSLGRLRRASIAVVALVALAVLGGRFSLYKPEAMEALQRANTLLIVSMPIESRDELPNELQLVDGFVELAEGAYTLEWSSDVDRLSVTRPRVGMDVLESLIIYRFENGYIFGCTFTPPSYKANCINITRLR